MRHSRKIIRYSYKIILIQLILTVLFGFRTVFADDTDDILNEYAEFYGDVIINSRHGTGLDEIPDFHPAEILQSLNKGEFPFTVKEFGEYVLKTLLGEVYGGLRLLVTVLALSLISVYLSELKSGFGADTVANSAFYVCYIIIAGVTAAAFYEAADCAVGAVNNTAFFMRVMLPVMLTALMTSGAVISAAMLEPTLLTMVEVAVWIIEAVFIPAVMITAALNIVNGVSEKFKTDRLVKLMGNAIKWGLTLTLTVFVSFAGLKSIAASGADGLAVKLSKFAASNLIPMVGGILAESVETVMSCSTVIKNSVGVLGIICLVAIALAPVLKLAALLIMFRLTAAIAEPVSDEKIVTCISRLADSISVLFSMITAVSVMFIMVITILINTGNNVIMLGR